MAFKEKQFKKELPVVLTPDEIRERGVMMAQHINKIEGLVAQKAQVNKEIGDEIKNLQADLSLVATAVRTGEEMQMIDVLVKADPDKPLITSTRLDTGEVFDTRAMTPDEQQEEMPGTTEEYSNEVPIGSAKG